MDTEQQEQTYDAPEPVGSSIMDGLREMRQRKVQESPRRLVLNVPGYENRLAVIYHYPPDGYQRAVKAVERELSGKDPNARLDGASDMLVVACAAVVARSADGDLIDPHTSAPLGSDDEPEIPDEPMRFDRSLAKALKIDVPPEVKGVGRFVVRQLFSPRGASTGVYDGDLAVISTSNQVFAWLNGAEIAIDEEASGE